MALLKADFALFCVRKRRGAAGILCVFQEAATHLWRKRKQESKQKSPRAIMTQGRKHAVPPCSQFPCGKLPYGQRTSLPQRLTRAHTALANLSAHRRSSGAMFPCRRLHPLSPYRTLFGALGRYSSHHRLFPYFNIVYHIITALSAFVKGGAYCAVGRMMV